MRRIWILFDLEQPRGFEPLAPRVNDSNCTSRFQMIVIDLGFHTSSILVLISSIGNTVELGILVISGLLLYILSLSISLDQ